MLLYFIYSFLYNVYLFSLFLEFLFYVKATCLLAWLCLYWHFSFKCYAVLSGVVPCVPVRYATALKLKRSTFKKKLFSKPPPPPFSWPASRICNRKTVFCVNGPLQILESICTDKNNICQNQKPIQCLSDTSPWAVWQISFGLYYTQSTIEMLNCSISCTLSKTLENLNRKVTFSTNETLWCICFLMNTISLSVGGLHTHMMSCSLQSVWHFNMG